MKLPSFKFKVSKKILLLSAIVLTLLMTAVVFVIVKKSQKATTPESVEAEKCTVSKGHLHFVVAEPETPTPTLIPPTPTDEPELTPTSTQTPQPTLVLLGCSEVCDYADNRCTSPLQCIWAGVGNVHHCRNPECPNYENCICPGPDSTP